MRDLPEAHMKLINAILDDEASPEQLREVATLRTQDPSFAAAHDALVSAEAGLRAYFTPPADVGFHGAGPIGRVDGRGRSGGRSGGRSDHSVAAGKLRVLAYAAIVALAATVAFFVMSAPEDPTRPNAVALHAGFVANPTPTKVCDTPELFVAYTREHLGESITASFEPGVVLVGWRAAGAEYGPDSRSRLLLAYGPAGEPVVVLFQPRGEGEPKSGDAGLRLHAAQFGEIEAWEISRLEKPVVLPRLKRAGE